MEKELADIIKGCIKKDRKYQEILYKRFAPQMYGICKNYAEDREKAMDFLQEGFISIFSSISKFENKGSFEGWVKRIIVRRCIDGIRQNKKYNVSLEEYKTEQQIELSAEDNEDNTNRNDKIKKLIDALPPKAALVLKLFVLDGYGHKEIAELLEISEGTSKSQLNRAKSLIRSGIIDI